MTEKNILGDSLQICSTNPMTGYHRDGYCRPNVNDAGKHYVCGLMNQNFLDFTASRGNDLSSVVSAGEKWCLCEDRWKEAYDANMAPQIIKNATHENTRSDVKSILINEPFTNRKKKEIDHGNIFFLLTGLFFVDAFCFDMRFSKKLFKFNFKKYM